MPVSSFFKKLFSIDWNFDEKNLFVVFFHMENEWRNVRKSELQMTHVVKYTAIHVTDLYYCDLLGAQNIKNNHH